MTPFDDILKIAILYYSSAIFSKLSIKNFVLIISKSHTLSNNIMVVNKGKNNITWIVYMD
jgi:hypothetical protein